MVFKHRPSTEIPKPTDITDEPTRKLFEDFGRMLYQTFRNIFDDLRNLEKIEPASALPTASADNRGKMMLVPTTAGADELHICIASGTTPAHVWKKVTIT